MSSSIPSATQLQYISGPVAWYYYKWDGRAFFFFADQHRSLEHNCAHDGIACSHFDAYLQPHDDDPKCYEIPYLLAKIFDHATSQHEYVDFFAEITIPSDSKEPFQSVFPTIPTINIREMRARKETANTQDDILEEDYNKLDYLHLIEYTFADCFDVDHTNCPYSPYVRFHQIDIRWLETSESLTIPSYTTYYVQYIVSDIPHGYDEVIEVADVFFEELITIAEELFDAYLLSTDFVPTIDRLFSPMKEHLVSTSGPTSEYVKEIFSVIENIKHHAVRSGSETFSIVKAQLEELRQDNIIVNGYNMADLIVMYFQEKFNQEIDLAKMSYLWRYYYDDIYTPTKHGEHVDTDSSANFYLQAESLLILFRIDILLMDAYVLAQMFHQKDSSISITYTGIEHTLDYVGFFDYIGVDPVDFIPSEEGEVERCIENPAFGEIFDV